MDLSITDWDRNVELRFHEPQCDSDTPSFRIMNVALKIPGRESVKTGHEAIVVTWTQSAVKAGQIAQAEVQKFGCLNNLLNEATSKGLDQTFKLLVPRTKGYIMRSNLFEKRLRAAQHIRRIAGFVSPGKFVAPPGF
ncbi:uncharacterized protein DSM5745_04587 [Aspergillus mulundensis]|uniref:Uncharacterized protein n=1 Tax=Aspergillus mulundensis TaxID=1810919 RepID=A0A3D8S4C0_9EURO|nr:hypothetical protein DSM5745_04587 [Aspergillus mulundensis]RDW81030.1 hypothetical protein DSM5745_04587 [Aspergillus mulundensis]